MRMSVVTKEEVQKVVDGVRDLFPDLELGKQYLLAKKVAQFMYEGKKLGDIVDNPAAAILVLKVSEAIMLKENEDNLA